MIVTLENADKLQEAIKHIQQNSNQTIADTLRYAASQVLRSLSATSRIRVAKRIPPMKCLKKVKGSFVLENVKMRNARTIYPNLNYYIFQSDRGEIKQNFAHWIIPNQAVDKKSLLKIFERKRAGLARDTLRFGLSKMGKSGGSYQSFASNFVWVLYWGNFNHPPAEGDNEFGIEFNDKLRYMNEAFKDPNALNSAVEMAAQQMVQKFDHSQSELAQKFNSQNNN